MVPRLDAKSLAGVQFLQYVSQAVFRNGEEYRDRLELCDDNDRVGIRGTSEIALVDLPDADASADWRADRRVADLGARIVDLRLVALALRPVLVDQRPLLVELLPAGEVFLDEILVALGDLEAKER